MEIPIRSRRILCRLPVLVAIVAAAILGSSIPAYATATSGITFKGNPLLANGQTIDGCAEAVIADVVDFKSFIYSYAPVGAYCSSRQSVPAGYLGTWLTSWKNGQYCGVSETVYNSVTASGWGVGGYFCSNPAGVQGFYTRANSLYYAGPSWPYNNGYALYPSTYSPSQSY